MLILERKYNFTFPFNRNVLFSFRVSQLTRKVAVLGGAFDPVHRGHLALAEDTWSALSLDEIWFVPSAQSPLKENKVCLHAAGRLELLRAALDGNPHFKIDLSEIDRGGVSYTIDTVRRFMEDHPATEFSWILGGDQLAKLHEWRDAGELTRLIRFIVFSRPGYPIDRSISAKLPHLRIEEIASRLLDISSSDIRARLAFGKPVNHLLPKPVAELIMRRNFYSF